MAARWKLNDKITGLARVCAGPRGSKLFDEGKQVATVYPLGGDWSRPLAGWYWCCAGKNTCHEPVATAEEAKAAALAYYKAQKKDRP